MHEPLITVVGNVARPPSLRVVGGGHAVADFRVASTPRRHDRSTDSWTDGTTIWFGVTTWRALAEHCAASLKTGDRVVVTGRLTAQSWTGDDGVERSGLEVEATTVGLDLAKGRASYERTAPLSITHDAEATVHAGDDEPGEEEEPAA